MKDGAATAASVKDKCYSFPIIMYYLKEIVDLHMFYQFINIWWMLQVQI